MRVVHTIPVPEGMTVEEAWQEIRLLGVFTDEVRSRPLRGWANVVEERDD